MPMVVVSQLGTDYFILRSYPQNDDEFMAHRPLRNRRIAHRVLLFCIISAQTLPVAPVV